MATSADIIGRLLADTALLPGERNLTRKRDEAPLVAPKPVTATAPPLTHDGKAVASVLMTLLEDRLEASDAEMANAARSVDGKAAASQGADDPSRRVAQRYAENGFTTGDDGARHMIGAADPARITAVPLAVSGDLVSFIQRSAALAAGRSGGRGGETAIARRSRSDVMLAYLTGLSALRIAGVAVSTLCLGVLIAGWIFR